MEDDAAARAAADAVAQTFDDLGLPARLRQVGVGENGVKLLAKDTMTDFALHRNVRPVKEVSELEDLLREIW
jgi:alcohol dehydrogenase class IV